MKLEQWLTRLEAAREQDATSAAALCLEALQKAPGAAVVRAMGLLRRLGHEGHGAVSTAAFERLCIDGLKQDPGCLGRFAVAEGLLALDWSPSEPWWRGVDLVQWEPVWGGRVDTAAGLRGLCALGLVRCGDARAPLTLARLLADTESEARRGAVRALREAPEGWALPLLAHRALLGVEDMDAQLDLLHGLLEREQAQAFHFVAQELHHPREESREAAAIAMGERGGAEGAALLWLLLEEALLPPQRRAAWIGLALSRCAEGRDALLAHLRAAPRHVRAEAALALEGLRDEELDAALAAPQAGKART